MVIPKSKSFALKVNFLLLVSILGLIFFLVGSSILPFRTKIFKAFFPKNSSQATQQDITPKVAIKLIQNNSTKDGVVNLPVNTANLTIRWTTTGEPSNCTGLSYSTGGLISNWSGTKDPAGGSFSVPPLVQKGVFVYSINCSNDSGDSDGDSLVLNVGAQELLTVPYISQFYVSLNEQRSDDNSNLTASVGDVINVNWNTLNTNSPFSVCVATGSWPSVFTEHQNLNASQNLKVTEAKIYKYNLMCSNENSATKKSLTVFVN